MGNLCTERLVDKDGEDRAPTHEEALLGLGTLVPKLGEVGAEVVVCFGRYALNYLRGYEPGGEVPWLTMEVANGLPWWSPVLGCWLFGVTHPAAGLRQPNKLQATWAGLVALKKWLSTERGQGPVVDTVEVDYRVGVPEELPSCVGLDTEGTKADPWCIQVAVAPGRSWFIPRGSADELRLLLERDRPLVVFHNANWDLSVLRALGIDILDIGLEWYDTYLAAFNLKVEPYGLKGLAPRHAGMYLESWEKAIGKYREKVAQAYLQRIMDEVMMATALELRWPQPADLGRKKPLEWRLANLLNRGEVEGDCVERWGKLCEESPELVAPALAMLGPMPPLRLEDVPQDELVAYSCADPDATLRIYPTMKRMVREEGLDEVVAMDHARLPLINAMQEEGMLFDHAAWTGLKAGLEEEYREVVATIHQVVGYDINPGSGDQVAEWCRQEFLRSGRCGLTKMTKTRTRESTDDNALKAIRGDHVAIELFLLEREIDTLLERYVWPLPGFIQPDGRLHPSLRPDLESGRLAAQDPNILAFPKRSARGKQIRSLFVAPEGHVFGSWDYSQIELRIAAEEAGDGEMLRAFAEGRDLHTSTAARLLGVPEASISDATRYPFKTLNFAILYQGSPERILEEFLANGITSYSLAGVTQLLGDWFLLYSGVKRFLDEKAREARRTGRVRDRWGRVRYLPGAMLEGRGWPCEYLREKAERIAGNHPIQGGAQGLISRAMGRLCRRPEWLRPVLQVHDELLMCFPEDRRSEADEIMTAAMLADQPMFGVPLKVSSKFGANWGALD